MVADPSPWRQDETLPEELRLALEGAKPPSPLPEEVLERVAAALERAGGQLGGLHRAGDGGRLEPSWARLSAASVKLGLAGAVALGVAWSAWKAAERQSAPRVTTPIATQHEAERDAAQPSDVLPVPNAALPNAALPNAAVPMPAKAAHAPDPGAVQSRQAPAAGEDLAAQARLLDKARKALGSSSDEAERWLVEYGSRFPKGQLKPESELIWVALELKRGDSEGARTRVQRLEQASEQPAIARRARKMLHEMEGK